MEDTLVGKEWQREGLTVHPSMHLFHSFFLALVLCKVVMLEAFLGHRQDNPLDRWPVHHTVSSSPVLYDYGLWERPRGNHHRTERTHCKLHTERPILHYTRRYGLFLFSCNYYYYLIWIFFSTFIFILWFFFTSICMCKCFTSKYWWAFVLVCKEIGGICWFSPSFFVL